MVWFNDTKRRGWDPLGLMPSPNELGSLFSDLFPSVASDTALGVFADDERVVVRAEVPGFRAGDVEITLEGGVLALRGERSEDGDSRSFRRRVRMPFRVDAENVRAKLENGLLEVELTRAEADRVRRIEILEGPKES